MRRSDRKAKRAGEARLLARYSACDHAWEARPPDHGESARRYCPACLTLERVMLGNVAWVTTIVRIGLGEA